MVQLPDDIVAREILPRLPVKSLFRFRCVSKQICAVIDSPYFITQHLNNHINSNYNQTITESNQLTLLIGGHALYSFSLQGLAGVSLGFPETQKVGGYSFTIEGKPTDQPLQFRLPLEHYSKILGSVKGLLCCHNNSGSKGAIVFLNLATRKYHPLPLPHGFSHPTSFRYFKRFFGFGYDPVSNDFKLLRIDRFIVDDQGIGATKAQVYSLRSNSWEMIPDLPDYDFSWRTRGEFVCGALHWVVGLPHNQSEIFAFDIVTENHKLVAKPDIREEKKCSMSVGKLGGCLSLTCNYNGRVDIWVMKDYEAKESWSQLFSFPYSEKARWYWTLTPLAYSERGDEILMVTDNKNIIWYNPDTRTIRTIYQSYQGAYQAFICGESMVPLSTKAEDGLIDILLY